MSEFLSNLAARSLGAFEAIAPRVPSRFEPTRRADGLLAGRGPLTNEGPEDPSAMEGTAGAEAQAADPADNRSRAGRRTRPTQEMDSSPRQPDPSPSESLPGKETIQPVESIAPHAQSREIPLTPQESVFRAKRIPGSQSVDSALSEAEAVQPLGPASTSVFDRSREAARREMPGRGTQRIRPAQSRPDEPQPVRTSTRSRVDSVLDPRDSDLQVSASVGTPGQLDESPAHAVPSFTQLQEISPASSGARARARSHETQNAASPAMPASVESELLHGESQTQSGPAASAGGRWPADTDRKFGLKPDRSLDLAPRQETPTRATTLTTSAEPASALARPAVSNPQPASQPLAVAAAEPSIRVTIGRVEVRAVFPDQPVKRTPPPRFRPRVSLDDYLSRSSGGRK
jgi:hypothetical protein